MANQRQFSAMFCSRMRTAARSCSLRLASSSFAFAASRVRILLTTCWVSSSQLYQAMEMGLLGFMSSSMPPFLPGFVDEGVAGSATLG
jgi:hypothetical protein